MRTPQLERGAFLVLLSAVTIAFGWVLLPFSGAVMWSVALAILFTPVYRWLVRRLGGRHNMAALITLALALVIVIIPLIVTAMSLVTQAAAISQRMRSGDLSFTRYLQQVVNAMPRWAMDLLDRMGLGDLQAMLDKVAAGAASAGQQIAGHAISIGQNTFGFVVSFGLMLYVLFFLLRDGGQVSGVIRNSLPLARPHANFLINKFTTVIRATVKGNVVVAVVQGFIGGVAFWALDVQGALLWGVVMMILSLLPAVGAALIWGPVAIYFLSTGSIWQGVVLIVVGVLVIGIVDNVLRPLLVGKETQMPDYIVLMSTVGGLSLFGINGFVIGPVIAAMFMAAWHVFATAEQEVDGVAPAEIPDGSTGKPAEHASRPGA